MTAGRWGLGWGLGMVIAIAVQAGAQVHAMADEAAIALPPPERTDPVTLGLMQGLPPPPDKLVTLANLLKYPNGRWGFHHLRALGPTANVPRGALPPTALASEPRPLDDVAFTDAKGQSTTIAQWQSATYTDALLVLHRGKVVYEKYYVGMGAEEPHVLWSVTKSFTGLLAAMLINEGRLDPNATVAHYAPELAASAWGDATVQQALDMTTGVQYREDYTDPKSPLFQYARAAGLIPTPAGDGGVHALFDFLRTLHKDGEHGTGFVYKSVDTEVVGMVLQRVTGKSYAELVSERIWRQLGAEQDAYVWVDPAGMAVTSIGLNATLRDLARFGEMLRNDGKVDGREVVPKAAIAAIRGGADREKFKASGLTERFGYSYHDHWWIPHDADGSFEAKGLNGQHIHVNPAAELVIIKLSSHPLGNTIHTHTIDRRAFAAIAGAVR